jgi:FKBP-type peptidyl-prolyl cis-trans isomerase SlyD
MAIKKDQMVSVAYKLRLDSKNGKVIENVTTKKPLVYLHGVGKMIPAFENALEGKNVGDAFETFIPSCDAYGEFNPDAVVTLPVSTFGTDASEILVVGNLIPMMTQDGDRVDGFVDEVNDTDVIMNFNHPMAGKNLHFTLKVVDSRDATPEELAEVSHVCGCDHGEECDC